MNHVNIDENGPLPFIIRSAQNSVLLCVILLSCLENYYDFLNTTFTVFIHKSVVGVNVSKINRSLIVLRVFQNKIIALFGISNILLVYVR